MTKEELIFMVQAIAGVHFDHEGMVSLHARDIQGIVNIGIKMGAAAEREACAKLMGELTCMGNAKECFEVAATYIRARGKE